MEFLFWLGILGFIIFAPIIFLVWSIKSILDLKSLVKVLGNDIELLSNRVLRLQNDLRKVEERPVSVAEPVSLQETRPATVKTTENASKTAKVETRIKDASPYAIPQAGAAVENPVGDLFGGTADQSHQESEEIPVSDMPLHLHEPEGAADTSFAPAGKDSLPPLVQPRVERPRQPDAFAARPSGGSSDYTDMESLIGGNLMSKAGAFLLVIGLALFLKYTVGNMSAAVKIAAAVFLSLSLLGAGILLSRGRKDDVLGIGLIGGGWSCLYLTAFAAHGVAATRVVESPVAGMALMLVVAAGMIVHSLVYKSEMATGLAYLFGFFSLFVTEVSLFSEIAAVVLTVGMVVLSFRFSWHQMAVSGLILTYASMLARLHWCGSSAEVAVMSRFTFVQSMLAINWLTFEIIGMIFLRSSYGRDEEPTRFLFALNFAAYVFVSIVTWPRMSELSHSYLAAMIVVQYLLSGVVRGFWCQAPGEAAIERQRFFLGSLEDCLVIATFACTLWLWYVLPALAVAIGWGILALLVVEVAFRAPWQALRFTGHLTATLAFLRVFIANFTADGLVMGISYRLFSIVPIIALMIHFYFRTDVEITWEAAPTGATRVFAPVYSYYAFILCAFLLRFEVGSGLTAPAWAIAAIFLSGFARMFKNRHFARQGVFLLIGAVGYGFSTDLQNLGSDNLSSSPSFIGVLMTIAMYLCRFIFENEEVEANDSILKLFDVYRKELASLCGTAVLAFLLYLEISGAYLTLAWALMGVILLLTGFVIRDAVFRVTGLGTAMVCIFKVFVYDARVLEMPYRILAFICLGGALILISWVYTRFKHRFEEIL